VVLVIGFIATRTFGLFFGYWAGLYLRRKRRRELTQEIQTELYLLLENGKIVENGELGHLAMIKPTVVTVASEGLLFRFIRWRNNFQLHVSSERLPGEWHELAEIINYMLPDEVTRQSIHSIQDVRRLLYDHLDLVKKAFSVDNYGDMKKKLDDQYRDEHQASQDYINAARSR
jgi:hypothetical protein